MEGTFSAKHPFITVKEAAFLCDVSQTTIRTKIKEYKMKTYIDDKGRIHIRTGDLLLYYHKRITGLIIKTEKELRKAINSRYKTLSEYYALLREYDDQFDDDTECCISESTLRTKLNEVYDSYDKLEQTLKTIEKQASFYVTVI